MQTSASLEAISFPSHTNALDKSPNGAKNDLKLVPLQIDTQEAQRIPIQHINPELLERRRLTRCVLSNQVKH